MAGNIVVGIDAGSSVVRTAVVEIAKKQIRLPGRQKSSESKLRILGVGKSLSQGIRKGCVSDFDDAVSSIRNSVKEAERSSGLLIKKAYLGVGGTGLSSDRQSAMVAVSRADREITDYDVKRLILQSETNLSGTANKHILHTIPLSFLVDRDLKTTRPVGLKGSRLEVETLFIAFLNPHLDDLVKSAEAAGLSVEDVVASPLAASQSVLNKRQKEVGSLLVDFGGSTVSLVVFEEGLPISLEVFPLGSTHITHDIALGLQLAIEDSEILKVSFGRESFSKRKLAEIIEARLGDIFDLIENHLKKIGRSGLLPGGIVLTGGGANLSGLADLAKDYLKLPASVGQLREMPGLREEIKDPAWSVALGLCILAAEEEDGPRSPLIGVTYRTKNAFFRWLRSFLP